MNARRKWRPESGQRMGRPGADPSDDRAEMSARFELEKLGQPLDHLEA